MIQQNVRLSSFLAEGQKSVLTYVMEHLSRLLIVPSTLNMYSLWTQHIQSITSNWLGGSWAYCFSNSADTN